jgi:hypothetical protein
MSNLLRLCRSGHHQRSRQMADFLLSPEGAKILSDLEYGSPLKPTSYKLWYPEAGMSMAQYDKAMEQWEKLLREIGRKWQQPDKLKGRIF